MTLGFPTGWTLNKWCPVREWIWDRNSELEQPRRRLESGPIPVKKRKVLSSHAVAFPRSGTRP